MSIPNIHLNVSPAVGGTIRGSRRVEDIVDEIYQGIRRSPSVGYLRPNFSLTAHQIDYVINACRSFDVDVAFRAIAPSGSMGSYQEIEIRPRGAQGRRSDSLQEPSVADVEKQLGVKSDMWDTLSAQEIVSAVSTIMRSRAEMNYYARTPSQEYYVRTPAPPEHIHNDRYYELTS